MEIVLIRLLVLLLPNKYPPKEEGVVMLLCC